MLSVESIGSGHGLLTVKPHAITQTNDNPSAMMHTCFTKCQIAWDKKKTYSSIWNLVSIALATNENNTENNKSTSNILWHKLDLVPDEYKYISGQIGTNYISYMDHEIILVLMGIVTDVYTSSF